MYEPLRITISLEGLGHDPLLTASALHISSSQQLICGLQGDENENTDTDVCGWPCNAQRS